MKKYKMVIISLLLLVFMIGAVSAADENATDDLEISDEMSVDEDVIASSGENYESEDILEINYEEDTLSDGVIVNYERSVYAVEGRNDNCSVQFLHADDNSPYVNATISFMIMGNANDNGEWIEQYPEDTTDENGYASFIVDLPDGYYMGIINGPEGSSGDFELVVINPEDYNPTITITNNNDVFVLGETPKISAIIRDGFNKELKGAKVNYLVNNLTGSNTTDNMGRITFEIDLPVGQHNITLSCPEIDKNKTGTIHVLSEPIPTVLADNIIMVKDDGTKLVVKCTDKLGNYKSGIRSSIQFDGEGYFEDVNVNKNCTAVHNINLDIGYHYVTIRNTLTYEEIVRNITVLAKPSVNVDENITLDNENKFSISFSDVNGIPLANASVSLIVGEDTYSFTTDENGTAIFDLGFLAPGNHTLTIVNPVTGEKIIREVNIPKVDTQISAPNVSTIYNGGGYVVITLKDVNNAVSAGKSISVVLNGKTITGVTDSNGQFKVSTDRLTPKTYTATITFAGDDYLNPSTATANVVVKKATPKMTAKKATFKAKKKIKKYSIVLKDNKNKAMKKVKVTLKVKGKTYKATTNAKGKATFKITKLTKKGKYTAKIKFAGNKNYNAVNKSVKITVKK